MKRAVWILTFAAAVNYAALVWFGMQATGGQKPLDLYITGYSYDDAMALLARLDFASAQYLATTVRYIDTSFPMLLGLAMAGWIWIGAAARGGLWRFLVVVPLAYTCVDLYENHLIAQILTGILPPKELVALASLMTIAKWCLVGATLVTLFLTASGEEK